jgi:hypothetical protein
MLISAVSKGMLKPTVNRQTHWNFGDPHGGPVPLEEFLAQQEAVGFSFFEGKEPWALRHPVVKDAITKALADRFPAR